MQQDIFYDVDDIPHDEQEIMLRKAYSICQCWHFDKLDCRESFARQEVKDISFEEAMSHFVNDALMRVIQRQPIFESDEPYLQVNFRSMESPIDYFLWIRIPIEKADEIIKGLERLT